MGGFELEGFGDVRRGGDRFEAVRGFDRPAVLAVGQFAERLGRERAIQKRDVCPRASPLFLKPFGVGFSFYTASSCEG
jgi:hypothetical protein